MQPCQVHTTKVTHPQGGLMQLEKANGRGRFGVFPIRSRWFVLVLIHALTRCSSATTAVFSLVAEPKPDSGEGSSCALRLIEPSTRDKTFVTHSLTSSRHSLLWISLCNTLWEGVVDWPWTFTMSQKKGQQRGKTQATGSGSMSSEEPTYADVRDSFVPLFNGQPSEYREWRQRVQLYYKKMTLAKKGSEGVLNIVGSFKGVVWRLFEDWSLERFEKDDAFESMLKVLDGTFPTTRGSSFPPTSRATSAPCNGSQVRHS